ncbi:MAG: response regulator transcription factor [Bacteroidota bacterium]
MGNQFRHLIIVEDNAEVREGFTLLIDSSERYQVINSYSNCEDALANLKQDQPDVALMDIDLPGMNGIQGTAEIKRRSPDTEIIMITVMDNYKSVFEALKSGASGYLTKNANASEILRAIDQVMDGGSPMSTKIARMVVQSFQKNLDSPLSDRETEVLGQMAAGHLRFPQVFICPAPQ